MGKTLKIDVPDDIHQALAGPDELLGRLQSLPRVELGNLSAADVIREAREERTNQIIDAVNRR